jgi:membrane protease YdiL (CAAX protease family)
MFRSVDSGHTDIAPPAARPAKSAMLFFLFLMALYLGLGATVQSFHPLAGLVWTELFVFLLPAFLVAAGSNLRPVPYLLLARRPAFRQLLLGALSGVALYLSAGAVMSLTILVVPRSWVEAFDVTRLFEGSRHHQLGMALAASLLAPFAEEVTFRGYLLSTLRTHAGPWLAIGASALLFAAMHVDPVRFPAVFLLGLYLGWLAWRSGSVWPAVAAHAVNNGIGSLVATRQAADPTAEGTFGASLFVLAVGLAALAPIALAWVRATPFPPDPVSDRVVTDPADPSIAFRLSRVPPGWLLLAVVGLVLYGAIALAAHLGR